LAEGRPRHWAIELDRPSEDVGSGKAAELATYVVDEADAETALAILTGPRNRECQGGAMTSTTTAALAPAATIFLDILNVFLLLSIFGRDD
jgi:hypothetical protein